MKPLVSRKGRKKNWNKVYIDRLEYNKEQENLEKQRNDKDVTAQKLLNTDIASKFILNIIGINNDADAAAAKKTGRMLCRHTLENMEPPSEHAEWKRGWGSQVLCDLCALPCITGSTICNRCDVITHNQCILDHGYEVEGYDCPNCRESIYAESAHYHDTLDRLEKERQREIDAQKIAKRLVIMVERKRLIKKLRSVVKVQSAVRAFLARRHFIKYLRAQMKLIILRLNHLPVAVMGDTCVLVITVFDTFKNSQSYRLDATCEQTLKQRFLIPGMGSNCTLLFTLAKTETLAKDGTKSHVMFAQAQLSLRDVIEFQRKNVFSCNFVEKIKYPPVESKDEFKYHLISYAAFTAAASSFAPSASLLPVLSAATSSAGAGAGRGGGVGAGEYMYSGTGSNGAVAGSVGGGDTQRAVHFPPADPSLSMASPTTTITNTAGDGGSAIAADTAAVGGSSSIGSLDSPARNADEQQQQQLDMYGSDALPVDAAESGLLESEYILDTTSSTSIDSSMVVGANNGSSGTAASVMVVNLMYRALLLSRDRSCTMEYAPQNPVTTLVGFCSGPPLDILKRAAEVGMKKKKGGNAGNGAVNYRTSRYWLCFFRMRLILYQYYGDLDPRLISDVSEATATVVRDNKGRRTTLVSILHSDNRNWLLEFNSRKEASKFELAINESRKAMTGESIYAVRKEVAPIDPTQLGFVVTNIY